MWIDLYVTATTHAFLVSGQLNQLILINMDNASGRDTVKFDVLAISESTLQNMHRVFEGTVGNTETFIELNE